MDDRRSLLRVGFATLLVGVFALAIVWATRPPPDVPTAAAPTPIDPPTQQASLDGGAGGRPSAVEDARSDAPVRDTMASPTPAATGTVLVHVGYDGGDPAAQMLVRLRHVGADRLQTREATTELDGTARFEQVPPGSVRAHLPHDATVRGPEGDVTAGSNTELRITLKPGLTIDGVVVDERGAPVANAAIVAAHVVAGPPVVVGRSGTDGTFHLRAMSAMCKVGARLPGYRPSPMRVFLASDGTAATMTIVLEAGGGSLGGIVLGPDGEPVRRASVRVGADDFGILRLPDGHQGSAPPPQTTWTDAEGRFLLDSVLPGTHPVAIRALELAPWQEDLAIASGEATQVTVRLTRGVTLVGTVRDRSGAAVADANVRVGSPHDIEPRTTRSATNGTFQLAGLPTGLLPVRADHESGGKVAAEVLGAPGETIRWDPVLVAGATQRGRVVGPDGTPETSATVRAQCSVPPWLAHATVDADGRFELHDCPEGVPIRLDVQRETLLSERDLTFVASANELVVELPAPRWGHVEGTLLDPDGEPRVGVRAGVHAPGRVGSSFLHPDPETGRFRFGPLPPGPLSLRFECDDLPALHVPEHTLAPDEVWELGTIRFPRGGTALVQLVTDATMPLPKHRAAIYRDGAFVDWMSLTDGAGRTPPLAAGTYLVQLDIDGYACRRQPVEIRAGAEARVDVPLQRGVRCEVACEAPADFHGTVAIEVRDAGGTIVQNGFAWRRDGRLALDTSLAPGTYSLGATAGELRGAATLTVIAPGPAKATVTLAK